MMSTIYSIFPSEPGLGTSLSDFKTGFTQWDIPKLFSIFESSIDLKQGLANDSGSVNRIGSDVAPTENTDERRKKRKLANRESAKRSREKKQKHLQEMNLQLNQLYTRNRELSNQLQYVLYHCQQTKSENDRLCLENRILQDKVMNIRQVLMFYQMDRSSNSATWPSNNSNILTVQQDPTVLQQFIYS